MHSTDRARRSSNERLPLTRGHSRARLSGVIAIDDLDLINFKTGDQFVKLG